MTARYTKLEVPSFDMKWVQYRDRYFMFIPGGGGSAKSGLKNIIQVYEILSKENVVLRTKLVLSEANKDKLCHYISVVNNGQASFIFLISILNMKRQT
jgi:hypothetical protein